MRFLGGKVIIFPLTTLLLAVDRVSMLLEALHPRNSICMGGNAHATMVLLPGYGSACQNPVAASCHLNGEDSQQHDAPGDRYFRKRDDQEIYVDAAMRGDAV